MDFTSLKEQVTNLTLYDLKAGVRKVQNGMISLPLSGLLSTPLDLSSREILKISC